MRFVIAVALALAATAASAKEGVVKMGFFACTSQAELSRAVKLSQSGDDAAIKQYIMAAAVSGACTWLKAGTRVEIEWSGEYTVLKVRPIGTIDTWFFRRELVSF